MYNVYFDSGTSNTRIYLLKDYEIIDTAKKNIGSKDSSIAGSNLVLIKGLKELYNYILENNGIHDSQIEEIYASGMVTSPFGIKEVPHLPTPVSLEKLYENIYTHYESEFFKRHIHLIRGAKTVSDDSNVDISNISDVNNMRGEEIEIFGILSMLPDEWKKCNIAIFLPGSHTHIAYIRHNMLYDILSTFSGELYHAIATNTILSNSIQSNIDKLDKEMVLLGFRALKEYGINRALYIAHATKVFNVCGNAERKSYLEGVINGGVVLGFEYITKKKWRDIDRILIAGTTANVIRVYEILLKEAFIKADISTLYASEEQSFAVKGFIELLKKGRLLCRSQS